MCYPKPGPRCSSHAKTALNKAILTGNAQEILLAQDTYDETAAGQLELRQEIQRLHKAGQPILELKSRRKIAAQRYRDKKLHLAQSQSSLRTNSTGESLSNAVLLRTQHGSHLYGLAHQNSDKDYYEVHMNSYYDKPQQKIVDGVDTLKVSLSTFMRLASSGNPQALETMFSPTHKDNEPLIALRQSFRADATQARDVYGRTILNFAVGDFKSRRHALRLALNYEQMSKTGRFNPVLSEDNKQLITDMAKSENYLKFLTEIFPYIPAQKYYDRGFSSDNI